MLECTGGGLECRRAIWGHARESPGFAGGSLPRPDVRMHASAMQPGGIYESLHSQLARLARPARPIGVGKQQAESACAAHEAVATRRGLA